MSVFNSASQLLLYNSIEVLHLKMQVLCVQQQKACGPNIKHVILDELIFACPLLQELRDFATEGASL